MRKHLSIDGIMDAEILGAEKKHQILVHHVIPTEKCQMGNGFFELGKDSKHKQNKQ